METFPKDVQELLEGLAARLKQTGAVERPHGRCWDFDGFHRACRAAGHVEVVDIGGHPHVYCRCCGVLRDVATVSDKLTATPHADEDRGYRVSVDGAMDFRVQGWPVEMTA